LVVRSVLLNEKVLEQEARIAKVEVSDVFEN